MGIMNVLRKMGENKKVLKERMAFAQQERKINKIIEEREKSSNERELERIRRDRREEAIKKQLQSIRAQETKDNWKGNNFTGKATMLNDDRPILKEKNLFMQEEKNILLDKKSKNPITQRGMFFKR